MGLNQRDKEQCVDFQSHAQGEAIYTTPHGASQISQPLGNPTDERPLKFAYSQTSIPQDQYSPAVYHQVISHACLKPTSQGSPIPSQVQGSSSAYSKPLTNQPTSQLTSKQAHGTN
jgi:hypothetical protein